MPVFLDVPKIHNIVKSTLLPAVGFVEEGGKFGILPDLLPETFSEMLCEGLRCLALIEASGQVGTDSPASVVAGGPSGSIRARKWGTA